MKKHIFVRGKLYLIAIVTMFLVACQTVPYTKANQMSLVTINVEKVTIFQDPPGNHVTFHVVNNSEQPIWLVDDDWFVWDSSAEMTEISFARGKMVPGVAVFGYFNPKVKKLKPSESISKEQKFEWPVKLSGIWNQEEWASPPSGTLLARIRIGFGFSPNISSQNVDDLTDIEESVLFWQQETTSEPFKMEIPNYPKLTKGVE